MRIEHIDQIFPAIEGRTDFVVAERDGYRVVDYVYAQPDSFDDPIRRECRGLKFDPDGRIIGRPFGKFFNIGERPETQPNLIDFSLPHSVMDKLDGSMVHPVLVGDEVVFMTRMGRSPQALQAEELFLTPERKRQMRAAIDCGITQIFEYTGPKNRIVLRYKQPELTLLSARFMVDGDYLSRGTLAQHAANLGLPLVTEMPSEWNDSAAFLAFVRILEGKEGFVIRFYDGEPMRQLLKAKGEDYVLKHKSKESIRAEKNVLALILTQGLDDILPMISEEEREAVEAYRLEVRAGMETTIEMVASLVKAGASMDQKTFAVDLLGDKPSALRGLAFGARRSGDARAEVHKMLMKNVGTQAQVDAVRYLFGAAWKL